MSATRTRALEMRGQMSERDIAAALGVPRSTVQNWFRADSKRLVAGDDGIKRKPLIDVDAAYAGRRYGVSPAAVAATHGTRMPPRPDARTYGGVASTEYGRTGPGPW